MKKSIVVHGRRALTEQQLSLEKDPGILDNHTLSTGRLSRLLHGGLALGPVQVGHGHMGYVQRKGSDW